ncbi:hypothetical protein AOLI_G00297290, partial [Acnodon oligacanthus]
IPSAAGRLPTPHCGAPLRPDSVQGRAGHPQLQGRRAAHAHRGVVQGRREGGDGPGQLAFAPHAAAQRLPLLPENSPRPSQQTGRGFICVRGPKLPRRSSQPQCLAG